MVVREAEAPRLIDAATRDVEPLAAGVDVGVAEPVTATMRDGVAEALRDTEELSEALPLRLRVALAEAAGEAVTDALREGDGARVIEAVGLAACEDEVLPLGESVDGGEGTAEEEGVAAVVAVDVDEAGGVAAGVGGGDVATAVLDADGSAVVVAVPVELADGGAVRVAVPVALGLGTQGVSKVCTIVHAASGQEYSTEPSARSSCSTLPPLRSSQQSARL